MNEGISTEVSGIRLSQKNSITFLKLNTNN